MHGLPVPVGHTERATFLVLADAVAVGAQHNAMQDLLGDARPRRTVPDECRNICPLGTDVVKLEHANITHSTVEARMLSKIAHDPGVVSRACSVIVAPHVCAPSITVLAMVLPLFRSITLATA